MEKFQCAACGGVFEKSSEEEALAEFKAVFGIDFRLNEVDIICDKCYQKVNPANFPHRVEEAVKQTLEDRIRCA